MATTKTGICVVAADIAREPATILAPRARVHPVTVRTWRRRLLIPRPGAHVPEGLLGTTVDRELAVRLGVPRRTVAHRRRRVGLSSVYGARWWAIACDPGLGVEPDRVVATRHDASRAAVARVRVALGIVGRQGRPPKVSRG